MQWMFVVVVFAAHFMASCREKYIVSNSHSHADTHSDPLKINPILILNGGINTILFSFCKILLLLFFFVCSLLSTNLIACIIKTNSQFTFHLVLTRILKNSYRFAIQLFYGYLHNQFVLKMLIYLFQPTHRTAFYVCIERNQWIIIGKKHLIACKLLIVDAMTCHTFCFTA